MNQTKLSPLEKARLAKQKKFQEKKAAQEKSELLNEAIKKDEPNDEPKASKKVPMNLETKMDAIIEKIPLIEQCKEICEFLLDHYGLQKQFQELMKVKSDGREKVELYKIFEYYGI